MVPAVASFILGLVGGLHCIGMCGPIAMIVHGGQESSKMGGVLYHIGRTVTYSVLGALVGLAGNSLQFDTFQQTGSLILGVIALGFVLLAWSPAKRLLHKRPTFLLQKTKQWMVAALKKKRSAFYIGLINGLLPCGLVYVALGGALVSGSILAGAFVMFAFGIGTIPLLFASGWIIRPIALKFPGLLNKVTPWFVLIMGVWLVLRGLDLGIPLISPELGDFGQEASCH